LPDEEKEAGYKKTKAISNKPHFIQLKITLKG